MSCFSCSIDKNARYWTDGGNAINVETTSYALLTQMALKRLGYSGPIVVWLTEQRQGGGGFVSTQVRLRSIYGILFYFYYYFIIYLFYLLLLLLLLLLSSLLLLYFVFHGKDIPVFSPH